MSEPTHYDWTDVEKLIQWLASTLDQSAATATGLDDKVMSENLAALLRHHSQEFGDTLAQHNAVVATEKANIEKLIQQAMADQQQAMAAAEKAYAAQPAAPVATGALRIPEADPGPRLRRGLLNRYGKRQATKPGEGPAGFETWLGSSMVMPAAESAERLAPVPSGDSTPVGAGDPVDPFEKAWMPFFDESTPPAAEPPPNPAPPPPATKPADTEKGNRGWATWMDESSGSGTVNT